MPANSQAIEGLRRIGVGKNERTMLPYLHPDGSSLAPAPTLQVLFGINNQNLQQLI